MPYKHSLYTTALGESMRDAFIQEASEFEYGKALFLVPNKFFRRVVGHTGLVRTASIDVLPRAILEMSGTAPDVTLISRYTQTKLLEQCIAFLNQKGKLEYFQKLADKKGFRDSLLRFIEELEKQGVSPEEWSRVVLSWEDRTEAQRQKDKELALFFTTYQALLRSQRMCDLQGLYEAAVKALQDGELKLPWQHLYFSEFNRLNGLQLKLIEKLAAYCDISFGLFYDTNRPELSAATSHLEEALLGIGFELKVVPAARKREKDLTAFCEYWQSGQKAGCPAQHVSLWEAPSAEAEIRGVLTAVKAKLRAGVKPQDMMLLLRNMSDYPGLRRYFDEYGIPTTLTDQTDMAGQPLCDFLSKLFAAALNHDNLEAYKALFRAPLAEFVWGIPREAVDELLYTKYVSSVDQMINLVSNLPKSHDVKELLGFVSTSHLPKEWRDYFTGQLDAWNLTKTWGEWHKLHKATLQQVKSMALTEETVRNCLDQMETTLNQCGHEGEQVSLAEVREFWQDFLRGTTLLVVPGDSQGIRVNEVSDVQGMTIPYVFIMGVRDGLFPYIPHENWIYNDKERGTLTSLGIPLILAAQDLEQDHYFFASAVAMAEKEVQLSWYADDDGGPSSYIELLTRFFDEDSLPVNSVRSTLSGCASQAQLMNFLAEQPELGEKEKEWMTESSRCGTDFFDKKQHNANRWDGKSPFNGHLDRSEKELHLSASALDVYLACPFRYLAGYVWSLDMPEERGALPTPDAVGNLFHRTLARFLGKHLREDLSQMDESSLQSELKKAFLDVYEEMENDGQLPVSPFTKHLKEQFENQLSSWLKKEIAYEANDPLALRPYAVEKAFGRKGSEWEALCYKAGDMTVFVSGQVDRIDASPDQSVFAVMDYKTGDPPSKTQITSGLAVQLPLYVKAVSENNIPVEKIAGAQYGALKQGIRKGGFWTSTVKAMDKKRKTAADAEAVMASLDTVIQNAALGIGAGEFPAKPTDGKCPDYCPARDICRYRDNPQHGMEGEDE
jgi:ATP-dependent helicase/nuclease subunit B